MLTPCIFKRGVIWILFFVLSMILLPFFGDEAPPKPAPAVNNASSQ
ncbi:hypothetical protein KDJ56_04305 [Brevibacillus composti]|uniref:Uncharacterized protein n=1 Tax=Brevibacillus composti TaxID=2796470 RepID=A0A7T5EM54_9BACL|nr:hypothetical protein [Brevibacillus composti]QQE75161.1 hypothetical protein JD108_04305 [Brevibacillus composti]QUO42249.1 hypothetical protein KDJ56_04305 [Brevibacillus composti]